MAASPPLKSVKSPIVPLLSTVTVNKVKHLMETSLGLKCVYVTGLPHQKIGRLRQHMQSLGFYTNSVLNLSYLGKNVVECLMKEPDFKAFNRVAKHNKVQVFERFDPCDYSDHSLDSHLGDYKIGLTQSELRTRFIERIANECLKCEYLLTDKFYRGWVDKLNASVQFIQIANKESSKVVSLSENR